MIGFWFAAMVACLTLAGVAAQLGWQLPTIPEAKQALENVRPRSRGASFRNG